MTEIVAAAGIDPAKHVRVQHDAEVEDHQPQPDENDNNRVEIEEHFVGCISF